MRARGLKHKNDAAEAEKALSRPMRARGLKHHTKPPYCATN